MSVDSIIIEFTQPSKDVAFLWGNGNGLYNTGQVQIYNENNQLVTTVPVGVGPGSWASIALNQYHQRIKKVVLVRPPVSNTRYGHIFLDNVQFTPVTTSPPVGFLDGVNIQQAKAWGWSRDPDDLSASNYVDCYVNVVGGQSVIMGRVLANLPSNDVGNHRFEIAIPATYRDGRDYQLRCYGLDAVGGDPPTLLTGSPKNFKFNAPIGNLDGVTTDGDAFGWAKDLDRPNDPIRVDFYLNAPAGSGGYFIGSTIANIYRADVGSHGFSFPIPPQYRDNIQYVIYAHGIDLTGDQNKVLSGSPKTFQLSPPVQSTTFVALPESPLDANNNVGGGKRIFPDKLTPEDQTVRNTVQVKARISPAIAGVTVYFASFDLDEPSTNSLPIDINGSNSGDDNRSINPRGYFGCPEKNCNVTPNNIFTVPTDAAGEAAIQFSVGTLTNPGDNFVVAASTKEADLLDANVINQDLDIRKSANNEAFQIGTNRTEMLTVWRRLHIEIDSMAEVQYNYATGTTMRSAVVNTASSSISVRDYLDPGRFQGGRMLVNGEVLNIKSSTTRGLTVTGLSDGIFIPAGSPYTLYDDDDFNSDNNTNGFDADNGEDVTALGDSLNLLKENDDKDCSDGDCNVFAAAYIRPEYIWASPYNTSNIPFVQNVTSTSPSIIMQQIDRGRFLNSGESFAFWLVYAQIAYQGSTDVDCDSITEQCLGGITARETFWTNVVRQRSEVPEGSEGSLVFIETTRDGNNDTNRARVKVVPHEIGHQFGIAGDDSLIEDCGLMCYSAGLTFSDEHLNIIRWRTRSPGQP